MIGIASARFLQVANAIRLSSADTGALSGIKKHLIPALTAEFSPADESLNAIALSGATFSTLHASRYGMGLGYMLFCRAI